MGSGVALGSEAGNVSGRREFHGGEQDGKLKKCSNIFSLRAASVLGSAGGYRLPVKKASTIHDAVSCPLTCPPRGPGCEKAITCLSLMMPLMASLPDLVVLCSVCLEAALTALRLCNHDDACLCRQKHRVAADRPEQRKDADQGSVCALAHERRRAFRRPQGVSRPWKKLQSHHALGRNMPHKHKRKREGDDQHYELAPTQRAAPLPVGKARAPNPAPRKKRKGVEGYGDDDTPKAFTRLMQLKAKGKPRSGLDDGPRPKSKKRNGAGAGGAVATATVNSEAQVLPKIQPGETLSAFGQRVNQALPLSSVQRKGKKVDGPREHRVTRHEKKLRRLQEGWRKEEARLRDKEEEERELAEEDADEIDAMWEDKTLDLPASGKKKGKKGRRKLVVGEVDDDEDDAWEALKKKREQRKGLHDVVQAPPELTKVPREIFKVKNGAKVNVSNVPNSAGSLRKREELGAARQDIIESYRQLMGAKRRVGWKKMVHGIDQLINFVLSEVALCGPKGAGSADFRRFVEKFHRRPDKSSEAPIHPDNVQALIDGLHRDFYERLWDWVRNDRDIRILYKNEIRHLSLSEFEALENQENSNDAANPAVDSQTPTEQNSNSAPNHLVAPPPGLSTLQAKLQQRLRKEGPKPTNVLASNALNSSLLNVSGNPTVGGQTAPPPHRVNAGGGDHNTVAQKDQTRALFEKLDHTPTTGPKFDDPSPTTQAPRIYASQDRMWHAIAGHSMDIKRLTLMEFELLTIIESRGSEGIEQPDLVKLTGQDKRSVPKRTDELAKKGYIEKHPIQAKKHYTSICIHRNYVNDGHVIKASGKLEDVFKNGNVLISNFVPFLDKFLEEVHAVPLRDLRKKMGVPLKTWNQRSIRSTVRRLEETGFLKRVRARKKGSADQYVVCIKRQRPSTREDIEFLRSTARRRTVFADTPEPILEGDAPEDGFWRDIELEMMDSDVEVDEEDSDNEAPVEERTRIVPQWTPSRLVVNLVFETIDAAGPAGLDNAQLRDRTMGKFWKRPLENLVSRITNDWEHAQPRHLRQLAVVRDTSITQEKKYTHYVFRSYNKFQVGVNEGHLKWEAISKEAERKARGVSLGRARVTKQDPVLDQWGFEPLVRTQFQRRVGSSSLKECREAIVSAPKGRQFWDTQLKETMGYQKPDRKPRELARNAYPTALVTREEKRAEAELQRIRNFAIKEVTGKPAPPGPATSAPRKPGLITKEQRQALGLPPQGRLSADVERQIKEHRKVTGDPTSIPDSIEKGEQPPKRKTGDLSDASPRPTKQAKLQKQATKAQSDTPQPSHDHEEPGPGMTNVSQAHAEQVPTEQDHTELPPDTERRVLSRKARQAPVLVAEPLESATPEVETHVQRIVRKYTERHAPGVYINPFATRPIPRGRPKKALMAVFKSSQLKEFDWFQYDPTFVSRQDLLRAHSPRQSSKPVRRPSATMTVPNMTTSVSEPAHHQLKSGSTDALSKVGDIIASNGNLHEPASDPNATISGPSVDNQINAVAKDDTPMANGPPEPQQSPELMQKSVEHQDPAAQLGETIPPSVPAWSAVNQPLHLVGQGQSFSQEPISTIHGNDRVFEKAMEGVDMSVPENSTSRPTTAAGEEVSQSVAKSQPNGVQGRQQNATRFAQGGTRGVTLGGGSVWHKRADIIIDIVSRCGGVFPNNGEIVQPFWTLWERNTSTDSKPDRTTLSKAIRDLCDKHKLLKVPFDVLMVGGSRTTEKSLITLPHISPTDEQAQDLKMKIMSAYPSKYYPEEVRDLVQSHGPTRRNAPGPIPEIDLSINLETRGTAQSKATLDLDSRIIEATKKREKAKAARAESSTNLKAQNGEGNTETAKRPTTSSSGKTTRPARKRLETLEKNVARMGRKTDGPSTLDQDREKEREDSMADSSDEDIPLVQQRSRKTNTVSMHNALRSSLASMDVEDELSDDAIDEPEAGGSSEKPHATESHVRVTLADQPRKNAGTADAHIQTAPEGQPNANEITTDSSTRAEVVAALAKFSNPDIRFYSTNHTFSTEFAVERFARPGLANPARDSAAGREGATGKTRKRVRIAAGPHPDADEGPRKKPRTTANAKDGSRKKPRTMADYKNTFPQIPLPTLLERLVGLTGDLNNPIYIPPMATPRSQYREENKSSKKTTKRVEHAPKVAQSSGPVDPFKQLLCTLVIASSLGTDEGSIDWSIVTMAYKNDHDFDLLKAKKCWKWVQRNMSSRVQDFTTAFQSAYLQAYENCEIAALEDPAEYDWEALVKWALKTCDYPDIQLPKERADLDLFTVEKSQHESWSRDAWVLKDLSGINRTQRTLHCPYASPLHGEPISTASEDTVARARSWVRSNIATPQDIYNVDLAHTKMNTLGGAVYEDIVDDMLESKVIRLRKKFRRLPGRNYFFTAKWAQSFRRPWKLEEFMDAVEFKKALDLAFSNQDPTERKFIISQAASNGASLAFLDMVNDGMMTMVPKLHPVNNDVIGPRPRISVWGFTEGDYRHRRIDPSFLEWDIELEPTSSYRFGNPLASSQPTEATDTWKILPEPPLPGKHDPNSMLPIWSSIDGKALFYPWWNRILHLVVQALMFQPGIPLAEIHGLCYNQAAEKFEIECVLSWLISVNAARQTNGTSIKDGGFALSSGFWAVFGDKLIDADADQFGDHVKSRHKSRHGEYRPWRSLRDLRSDHDENEDRGEDAVNGDAINNDAINDDAINDDAINDDAINDDAINNDAINNDAINKGAAKSNVQPSVDMGPPAPPKTRKRKRAAEEPKRVVKKPKRQFKVFGKNGMSEARDMTSRTRGIFRMLPETTNPDTPAGIQAQVSTANAGSALTQETQLSDPNTIMTDASPSTVSQESPASEDVDMEDDIDAEGEPDDEFL
ncbi:hypothetical protein EJ04DRAFT_598759 [Polyplosphaeria fusca]|uniref:B-block binding subunit of TFIIIC domain-containing protein n=1 Tax=Polyplosphaeria fusca TaxID=682080 RepID=A0A9P4R3B7_9PLEO|nr:hypothetical protein EJ04DRAFT_598759 [Polyplosphaeria fusca]